MCGGTYSTQTQNSQIPNRHQVRSAMRKVARTMRKDKSPLAMSVFVDRVMHAGDWNGLSLDNYEKTQDAILKAAKVSTFFNRKVTESYCGSFNTTYLTVRKSAIL